ncbi:hypothetical protein DCAR_0313516 [Daucus carota subsp. sativus]|uniref:Uncharacterized protein n=1 Tax=Daucus carota subsp. sativus TaxID=79200 RepID=A0AAF0WTD7_DAUCS|nr:hypothetical protein DCAR_0313516 [Daucus carota subsp. sativus]
MDNKSKINAINKSFTLRKWNQRRSTCRSSKTGKMSQFYHKKRADYPQTTSCILPQKRVDYPQTTSCILPQKRADYPQTTSCILPQKRADYPQTTSCNFIIKMS